MKSMPGPKLGALVPNSGNLFKYDGPAGTVVFLVALPLCLGIALASGAPLFAGIVAGMVGGIVVSVFSGSQVSVSGPAAGLTVIVASAIIATGSFKAFLLSVVLAGVLQFLMGVARLGAIADYVPDSVIKGMLAAIGLVIILKQIPHALGRDKDFEGDMSFLEPGGSNTVTDIIASVMTAHRGAVIISVASLVVLLFWDDLGQKIGPWTKLVPAPLIVVALGIALNQGFRVIAPQFQLRGNEYLVSLPAAQSVQGYFSQFMFPDFSAITNRAVLISAATIAIVASLESLLSLEAADRLDPFRRISSASRELRAQGIGNIVSGLLGGLPVTSVVVRTSANVAAGGRTWVSAFIHGALLFASTLLIPAVLNLTPLACLSAILIVLGYKLAKPSVFRSMHALGWNQFVPFLVTVTAIVFTDLLKGVVIGIFVGVFFVMRTNHHAAITLVHQDYYYLLRFNKDASFVNKNELKRALRSIPNGAHLIIDGTKSLYTDQDIVEIVEGFQKLAPYKDITLELKHFEIGAPANGLI